MKAQYFKLENQLVLLAWLNSLFGYESNKDLLNDTKHVGEGFDSSGRSYLYYHLVSRHNKLRICRQSLERYDENIRAHLASLNYGRAESISLRYFQHLAAFYTEVFLDRYFNDRTQMIEDLNSFVYKRNETKLTGEASGEGFEEEDLSKLAFWMATGSGKTLIFHLNYYQFLHYNTEDLDNVILITPNEGLTDQHLAEMAVSGIRAHRFDFNSNQLFLGHNVVKVIEITKLVEQKRGGGVSAPVEAFEGRNLIFVDEGHKGSGGEAWRGYREALAKTGFTFEYSATFGQALSAARRDPLTVEYGKSIVFDYSYYYFYSDGFGKDFRILNLREEIGQTETEMLLLGNLLSFYEQLCIFLEQSDEFRAYNLEKPLWIFVGATVNAVYIRNQQRRSDVLTVIRFLHHVLENKGDWVINGIEKFLAGDSGLTTSEGHDVFAGRFEYLRQKKSSGESMYSEILKKVFHSEMGGALHLCDIRARQDELALKVSGAETYFGLIYIGDTPRFKNLVEEDSSGIILEDDAMSGSLFGEINEANSKTNILIGARKFMEGWNSWRVSNMGLLNIGRREGALIIQLFGRGVRLRGKDYSLKRSAALAGSHPSQLRLLETLNIFAVRANYMAEFREYLEREGLDVEDTVEMTIPVTINEEFLKRDLVIPRPIENSVHLNEDSVLLDVDKKIELTVDLSVKVHAIASGEGRFKAEDAARGESEKISTENLDLIDWDQIYLQLLAYKRGKKLDNLVIGSETPRKIVEEIDYTLIADKAVFDPGSFAERMLLQNAISAVLRNYVDRFYRVYFEGWASRNMVYTILDTDDPNLCFNAGTSDDSVANYWVKVKKSEPELITAIENLLPNLERLPNSEYPEIPHIYFDRHLYLPLLLAGKEKMASNPPGLEDSEVRFVKDLKQYWNDEGQEALKDTELFLLRNLSRGKGVGFFKNSGFYPDFIMWLVNETEQRLVFIEPHGMIYAPAYIHDEKAQLQERLVGIAEGIKSRSRIKNVSLDAYIISSTPYEDLHKNYDDGTWDREKFAEKNILFLERNEEYDYVPRVLGIMQA